MISPMAYGSGSTTNLADPPCLSCLKPEKVPPVRGVCLGGVVRSVVLCTSSTCTNEPTGEDLCVGYLNGRESKSEQLIERLGTWSRMIWVVLEATRQIGRCWLSLIPQLIVPRFL